MIQGLLNINNIREADLYALQIFYLYLIQYSDEQDMVIIFSQGDRKIAEQFQALHWWAQPGF